MHIFYPKSSEEDDDVNLVSIGLVRMEMQVAEEGPREPAARVEWNVDKKAQDAVVWPLVVTKPLSTSLTSPPSPPSPPSPYQNI